MNVLTRAASLAIALCLPLGFQAAQSATVVDGKALSDQAQGKNWLAYGRNFYEQRYSPLTQINTDSVKRLGLAWNMPLPHDRSLLGTPLVVDGVMYFSGSWSVTRAVEARTGKLLWEYDPKSIEHAGDRLRISWDSNRGLAYWKGTVVICTIDGRLIALDARTGKVRWSTQTTDPSKAVYISGHPKAFRGLVLIGNGGTEFGASRGYVSAYHITSGKLAWRWYVVPGNPADGFEDPSQEMAAKTWTGEWWKFGGGGNVWNGITYDPEFNQILLGTGNGSPWNRKVRSPGGGDNLFLCSIVALDADTGKYKWHYQTVPGETWDYNSSMDIVLADLDIEGKKVKAALHAPKNGFFYVLDRSNGKLLKADKFAKVNWATGVDLKTGRPIEVQGARYEDGEEVIWPGPLGAHNWHAMSYSPRTGWVYIPKQELPAKFNDTEVRMIDWRSPYFGMDTAVDMGLGGDVPTGIASSSLIAWDPIQQKQMWEVAQPEFWNAGTMVTAGDVVFQGGISGEFAAYHAKTGEKLWSVNVGSGISAPPITYEIDGRQYVSLLVGFGGAGVSLAGGTALSRYGWSYRAQVRQLYTFALDARNPMPKVGDPVVPKPIVPPDFRVNPELAAKGEALWKNACVICHGAGAVSGGYAPDLRASPIFASPDALKSVVVGGLKVPNGMPRYTDMTDADLNALQHYVRQQAAVVTTTKPGTSEPAPPDRAGVR
ncbi:MAG: alcohol dehydrogenase [Panacagrimonas sp.]|jgi:quinohemoprotein ethanol dehydrogenase|nr:PQQ-dependent dehydrogenase, methanol/ethanol family [Panacagrimonas sp.]MCC2656126.1 alcohol dehydrogenase [Panacagrimonas sp.]